MWTPATMDQWLPPQAELRHAKSCTIPSIEELRGVMNPRSARGLMMRSGSSCLLMMLRALRSYNGDISSPKDRATEDMTLLTSVSNVATVRTVVHPLEFQRRDASGVGDRLAAPKSAEAVRGRPSEDDECPGMTRYRPIHGVRPRRV